MSCNNETNIPEVDETSMECCEILETKCIVTSEANSSFAFGSGITLDNVFKTIGNFFRTLLKRVEDNEQSIQQINNNLPSGATGDFETVDGKQVVVVNGIVTEINEL